jgi:hypothetical protein
MSTLVSRPILLSSHAVDEEGSDTHVVEFGERREVEVVCRRRRDELEVGTGSSDEY